MVAPLRSVPRGARVRPGRGSLVLWPVGSMIALVMSLLLAVSVVVDEDAADVAALEHVPVALVDLVEAVATRDQLVELELAGPVEPEQPRHVVQRVGAAEQRALDVLV